MSAGEGGARPPRVAVAHRAAPGGTPARRPPLLVPRAIFGVPGLGRPARLGTRAASLAPPLSLRPGTLAAGALAPALGRPARGRRCLRARGAGVRGLGGGLGRGGR